MTINPMSTVPKIVPISDIRNHHKRVLELAQESPVVLAQHSRSAAVLVSIEQWDKMATRMAQLEEFMASHSEEHTAN